LKMELIQGSETSENYILTPGIYPKEHIHYSNHGESLKSKMELSLFIMSNSITVQQQDFQFTQVIG
jgi:hypothetical protein